VARSARHRDLRRGTGKIIPGDFDESKDVAIDRIRALDGRNATVLAQWKSGGRSASPRAATGSTSCTALVATMKFSPSN